MKSLPRVLVSRFSSEQTDGFIGQSVCYLASIAVLFVGFIGLPQILETRVELFFGVCLLLILALLLVVLGTLLRLISQLRS